MSPRVLGDLSPARFLAEYWQKQPLVVRGAWPGFRDPFTPEELAGLACEEGVKSWLMLEQDGEEPAATRHGPFTDADFLSLPDTGWTLRVADVEKHAPDLATLLEPFRFIPDWRVHGLTISCATPPATAISDSPARRLSQARCTATSELEQAVCTDNAGPCRLSLYAARVAI